VLEPAVLGRGESDGRVTIVTIVTIYPAFDAYDVAVVKAAWANLIGA
jgi:hypothetical protein